MKKWMRLTDACFLTCDMSKFLQKQWYLGLHLMGPNSIHMAIKTHSIRKLHQCMAAIRTLPPRPCQYLYLEGIGREGQNVSPRKPHLLVQRKSQTSVKPGQAHLSLLRDDDGQDLHGLAQPTRLGVPEQPGQAQSAALEGGWGHALAIVPAERVSGAAA